MRLFPAAERRRAGDPMTALVMLCLAYLACFVASAMLLQARSEVPPWVSGGPPRVTAALLWMLSLTSLLVAHRKLPRLSAVFWLCGSAALAALAIDEIWEFHERSSQAVGDDDPFKVAAWLASGGVLYWIGRSQTAPGPARMALAGGFLLQTLWLFVELGDGDLFRVPGAALSSLRTAEEIFELCFLATFLLAFVLILCSPASEGEPRPTRGPG